MELSSNLGRRERREIDHITGDSQTGDEQRGDEQTALRLRHIAVVVQIPISTEGVMTQVI